MARTDNDSWDLASSVGATATAVAASRAVASQGPDALLDDPFAEPLVRAVGLDEFVKVVDGESFDEDDPVRSRQAMSEQIAVRTRFFDDFFTDAPPTQGYGKRSFWPPAWTPGPTGCRWPANTVVYEVDQPEVIAFKTAALDDLGATPKADRKTVAIDLRDDWPSALRAAGFDPARPTAWIAEGLLPYLPPDAQDRLFDNITALSAPGSRLATEHMDMTQPARRLGRPNQRPVASRGLRHQSERPLLSRRAKRGTQLSVVARLARHGRFDQRTVRRTTVSPFPTTNWSE